MDEESGGGIFDLLGSLGSGISNFFGNAYNGISGLFSSPSTPTFDLDSFDLIGDRGALGLGDLPDSFDFLGDRGALGLGDTPDSFDFLGNRGALGLGDLPDIFDFLGGFTPDEFGVPRNALGIANPNDLSFLARGSTDPDLINNEGTQDFESVFGNGNTPAVIAGGGTGGLADSANFPSGGGAVGGGGTTGGARGGTTTGGGTAGGGGGGGSGTGLGNTLSGLLNSPLAKGALGGAAGLALIELLKSLLEKDNQQAPAYVSLGAAGPAPAAAAPTFVQRPSHAQSYQSMLGLKDGGPVHMKSGDFVFSKKALDKVGGIDGLRKRGYPAQKITGPGTGTSDSIPATIDGVEPARVANGEALIRGGAQMKGLAALHKQMRRA